MANTENISVRPKCKWKVPAGPNSDKNGGTKECGSEESIYTIKGQGKYTSRPRETEVCRKHLGDATKEWNYNTAEPWTPPPPPPPPPGGSTTSYDRIMEALAKKGIHWIDRLNLQ